MSIELHWHREPPAGVDKSACEQALRVLLPVYLGRFNALQGKLAVCVFPEAHRLVALVLGPAKQALARVAFDGYDLARASKRFSGGFEAAGRMLYMTHAYYEHEASRREKVRTEEYQDRALSPGEDGGNIGLNTAEALFVACGFGDMAMANAYLERGIRLGERMEAEQHFAHQPPFGGDADIALAEAEVLIARLLRYGAWDQMRATHAANLFADWYLAKGRKDMWPQLLRPRVLAALRFCYLAEEPGLAKHIWAKLKRSEFNQDMDLWAEVAREKAPEGRARRIRDYLDALPRDFHRSGPIMNGITYQADLALIYLRLNGTPYSDMTLAKVSEVMLDKPGMVVEPSVQ